MERLTEIQIRGVDQRTEDDTNDDGTEGQNVLFLSQVGVHGKRSVEVELLLLLVDLNLDLLLDVAHGLDRRGALREGMDGRISALSNVRHGVRM